MTSPAPQGLCWLCDNPDTAPDPRVGVTGFWRCASCGFLFQPSRASAAEEERRYREGYFEEYANPDGELGQYDAPAAQRAFEGDVRVRFVTRWTRAGSLLEVGAASGHFVEAARRRGFDASGIEPSARMVSSAAARDVPVAPLTLREAASLGAMYDVVCAWHVVEHLPEPLGALEDMWRLVVPGGWLFLELPNADSVQARRKGPTWPPLEPQNHVAHYGPASLRAALVRSGFQDIGVSTVSFREYREDPRMRVVHRAYDATVLRTPGATHATRHELLRVVARRAAEPR